jgi:hypothetical protein
MLRPANEFKHFKLRARDGDIGKAREFYFDDEHWTVRYLFAKTGGWLNGRQVLISPCALKPVNEAGQVIPVELTRKQIEDSPLLASPRAGDGASLVLDGIGWELLKCGHERYSII